MYTVTYPHKCFQQQLWFLSDDRRLSPVCYTHNLWQIPKKKLQTVMLVFLHSLVCRFKIIFRCRVCCGRRHDFPMMAFCGSIFWECEFLAVNNTNAVNYCTCIIFQIWMSSVAMRARVSTRGKDGGRVMENEQVTSECLHLVAFNKYYLYSVLQ